MKPQERELFETILRTHPNFLDLAQWEEGPDPPDVIVTDKSGRRIGVELTEWLDTEQTTRSITIQEHEIQWLFALDTEHYEPPNHFSPVQITFRPDVRFSELDRKAFCREFYELIAYLDQYWTELFGGTPQKLWNDFTKYPTLRRYMQSLWLRADPLLKVSAGGRWVISEGKGGAYDPNWATKSLLSRIESKKNKLEYQSLKSNLKLDELVLLVHYGIRGILHNTPFEGVNRTLDDVLADVRKALAMDAGPFDRVFLYFAYNEGRLEQVCPA